MTPGVIAFQQMDFPHGPLRHAGILIHLQRGLESFQSFIVAALFFQNGKQRNCQIGGAGIEFARFVDFGQGERWNFFVHFPHVRAKPVTMSGNSLDVLLAGFVGSQRLAQHRDIEIQVPVFDKSVGPDCVHQIFPRNQLSVLPDQDQQGLDGFGRERHGFAVSPQARFFRVKTEGAKLV